MSVLHQRLIDKLRHQRKRLGKSQADLAAAAEVSPGTIASWETGRRQPRLEDAEAWGAALGLRLQLRFVPLSDAATTSAPERFSDWLRATRERAGVSRNDLERAMGMRPGYTANLEHGRIKPPGKAACDAIDVALSIPAGTAWSAAAEERLAAFDEDLLAWHRQQRGGSAARLSERLAEANARLQAVIDAATGRGA